jgi:hypothetical protein
MRSPSRRLLLKGAIAYALLIGLGWGGGHRWFLGLRWTAAAQAALVIGSVAIARPLSDDVGFFLFCGAVLWLVLDFFRLPRMVVASGPNLFGGTALASLATDKAGNEEPLQIAGPRAIAAAPMLDEKIEAAASLGGEEAANALRRFAEVRHRLSGQVFDDDLAREVEAIERRHVAPLLSEYVQSRRYCTGGAAVSADRALTEAAERLTARLEELSETQAARDVSDIETMGHFLRERHPIARDDRLGSSASG